MFGYTEHWQLPGAPIAELCMVDSLPSLVVCLCIFHRRVQEQTDNPGLGGRGRPLYGSNEPGG